MGLDAGFPHSVLYDFFFWYYVEGIGGYHWVTDSFDDFSDLNPYVPEESIDVPPPNDHNRFWV